MLTIETLDHLEALLTSDQVTLKGSQFMTFGSIVQAIQQERAMIKKLMAPPVGGVQSNGGLPTIREVIDAKIKAADDLAAAEEQGRKQ